MKTWFLRRKALQIPPELNRINRKAPWSQTGIKMSMCVVHCYVLHQNWDLNNFRITQLTQCYNQVANSQQVIEAVTLLQHIATKPCKFQGLPKSLSSDLLVSMSVLWFEDKRSKTSAIQYAAFTCQQANIWSLHKAFKWILRSLPQHWYRHSDKHTQQDYITINDWNN